MVTWFVRMQPQRLLLLAALVAGAAALALLAEPAAAQNCVPGLPGAPPNDCFAMPTDVTANNFVTTGNTAAATEETIEPTPGYLVTRTVWYRWTPTTSGTATVRTCGSAFDTALGVYTGMSINNLVLVAQNNNNCGTQSQATFACQAGTTYQVQVSSYSTNPGGALNLSMDCSPPCGYVPSPALYNYTDISATGIRLSHSYYTQINVGVPWYAYFCGAYSNTIRTAGAGFACFGMSSSCSSWYPPTQMPSTGMPNGAVYGYWSWLYPNACNSVTPTSTNCGTKYQVMGTAPNRVFIYSFKDVPFYASSACSTPPYSCAQGANSFQIKLFEFTHCWEVHYQNVVGQSQSGYRAFAGMENQAGTQAYTWRNEPSPGFSAAGQAWKVCPGSPPPPECSPASQLRAAGQTATFNALGGYPAYTWSAPTGTTTSGSGSSFSTSFNTVGTHTVTLTDSTPNSVSCTVTVPPPTCLPFSQTRGVGQTAFFSVNYGAPAYTWSAPGASTTTGTGTWFSTSYPAPGTYTVQVRDSTPLTSNCTVTVPALTCSPATQTRITGQQVTFTASWGTSTYAWSVVGGSPTSGSGWLFNTIFNTPGTYSVRVTSGTQTATCSVVVVAPACGYWTYNNAPYNYTDIDPDVGGGGTRVPGLSYLSTMALQPSPAFTFNLCGTNYQTFWLSGAGLMCMGPTNVPTGQTFGSPSGCTSYSAMGLPNGVSPSAAVYGYWGLLSPNYCTGANVGSANCVFYKVDGVAPNRVLIYEFKNATMYSFTNPYPSNYQRQTFQIKLYETTNCIEVHFKNVQQPYAPWPYWPSFGVASGFESSAPGIGYQYAYSPARASLPGFTRNQEAWVACPNPRLTAVPDTPRFVEDQPAGSFNVLANDFNIDANFAIVSSTLPSRGTLTGPFSGSFTYKPNADFSGVDTFTYTIRNATGQVSTATVSINVQAVNDAPRFAPGPNPVLTSPLRGTYLQTWATDVQAGPTAATDESSQWLFFDLVSNSNPTLFTGPPTMVRTATSTSTLPVSPPTSGAYGLLRFVPMGHSGASVLCFRARDNGGTATVISSGVTPPYSATGVALGETKCFNVVESGPPVAYFEPMPTIANPGQGMTFDACPGGSSNPTRCSVDYDGVIVAYDWDFGDGLVGQGLAPVHAFDSAGSYVVRLTVTDDAGLRDSTVRTLQVQWPEEVPVAQPSSGAAIPPMADAGGERTVFEGESVTLLGSQRGANDHALYQWTRTAGPAIELQNATMAHASFVAPTTSNGEPIQLQFALVVSDGALTSVPDYATVTVLPRQLPPVAEAGPQRTVTMGERVTLEGQSSHDGQPGVTYSWSQVEGPSVTLSALDQATPSFTAPDASTVLKFRLRVQDAFGSGQDDVVIFVRPAEELPLGVRMHVEVKPAASGADVVFTAVGVANATWDFGDGSPTATGNRVVHHYEAGTYDATMNVGTNTYAQRIEIADNDPKARPVVTNSVAGFAWAAGILAGIAVVAAVAIVRWQSRKSK